MEVVYADGIEGARSARGVAVVIDVLRAFTVSAYAVNRGAAKCLLVATVEQARQLANIDPTAVISAEVNGLPVDGILISNSPTMVDALDLTGRTLIQRSTSGVQSAIAARHADHLLAAALVNAKATAQALKQLNPPTITLIATGTPLGHPEDRICADLIAAYLNETTPPPTGQILDPIYKDPRYQRSKNHQWPGCPPSDMDLALAVDRFDFAMVVEPDPDAATTDCATLYRR